MCSLLKVRRVVDEDSGVAQMRTNLRKGADDLIFVSYVCLDLVCDSTLLYARR